jgi:hypothetical protein
MLHNPNWNKTKEDLSLDDFIGWLETKDPATKYYFFDCNGECLVGQYMAYHGIPWGDGRYAPTCRTLFGYGSGWGEISVAAAEPNTFGAALKRAKIHREKQDA